MDKENLIKNVKFPLSLAIINKYKLKRLITFNCGKKSKFQAASISKILTALLVLKLVEENKLNLNKDVNYYLKNFKVKNEDGKLIKITLKQLLSHTARINVSGFPGYNSNVKIPSINQILNGKRPCNTKYILAKNKPKNKYSYSGGGYMIIQKIIEDVTKKKFEYVINTKILKPLKMNNSDFKIRKLKNSKVYPEKSAAGLWSTPEDLSKLLIEIQLSYLGKSNKIISRQLTRKMLNPIAKAEGNFIGLGPLISKNKDKFYHTGHNYKFRSVLIGSIKKGYGFVVMVNSDKKDLIYKILKKLK
jgi:CubicO group peptidase (beta-lactamase class C family)